MPEIPLLSHGKPLPPFNTHDVLYAIMVSPRDVASLESYLTVVFQSPHSRLVKQLVTKFEKTRTGGTIAGEVFHCLLSLGVHHKHDASVAKAVFLTSNDLEKRRGQNGRGLPSSVDRVHSFWAQFQPAAHLWAAWLLVQEQNPEIIFDASKASEMQIKTLNEHILFVADALLSKAITAGIAFNQQLWTLPDGYPRKICNIDVLPIEPSAMQILKKDYKAPVRNLPRGKVSAP
jgi:hypothetical protein